MEGWRSGGGGAGGIHTSRPGMPPPRLTPRLPRRRPAAASRFPAARPGGHRRGGSPHACVPAAARPAHAAPGPPPRPRASPGEMLSSHPREDAELPHPGKMLRPLRPPVPAAPHPSIPHTPPPASPAQSEVAQNSPGTSAGTVRPHPASGSAGRAGRVRSARFLIALSAEK